jgi:hypothetical protein
MALSQQSMRPVDEGIPGGSSSDPPTPQDRSAFIRGWLFKIIKYVQIRWGNILAQVIIALSNHLMASSPYLNQMPSPTSMQL